MAINMKIEHDMNTLKTATFISEKAAWDVAEDVFGADGGSGSGYEVYVFAHSTTE